MSAIIEALEVQDSMPFTALFDASSHQLVVIVTFLALLELIRIKVMRVFSNRDLWNDSGFSCVYGGGGRRPCGESEWKNPGLSTEDDIVQSAEAPEVIAESALPTDCRPGHGHGA